MIRTGLVIVGLTFSLSSNAALYDRGNGMIYDDVLDITWLQDANYAKTSGDDVDGMLWWNAIAWVDQLVYGGFDDWRLPNLAPSNGVSYDDTWAYDGSSDRGYNITSPASELAYMFYVNLNGVAWYDTSGVWTSGANGRDDSFANGGDVNDQVMIYNIVDIFAGHYWYDYELSTDVAMAFNMGYGEQNRYYKDSDNHQRFSAWAVRDGDVSAVPVPATAWLIGSALIGLVWSRRKN
tara:strand:+ start:1626 stop:2333 length:708 start_codon:yes stop_codon:yes gene_type:complete